jgi:hypothetical protein
LRARVPRLQVCIVFLAGFCRITCSYSGDSYRFYLGDFQNTCSQITCLNRPHWFLLERVFSYWKLALF